MAIQVVLLNYRGHFLILFLDPEGVRKPDGILFFLAKLPMLTVGLECLRGLGPEGGSPWYTLMSLDFRPGDGKEIDTLPELSVLLLSSSLESCEVSISSWSFVVALPDNSEEDMESSLSDGFKICPLRMTSSAGVDDKMVL